MASNGFNGDGRGCGGHTCIVEFCGNDLVVILGFCPKIQDISKLTIVSHRRVSRLNSFASEYSTLVPVFAV